METTIAGAFKFHLSSGGKFNFLRRPPWMRWQIFRRQIHMLANSRLLVLLGRHPDGILGGGEEENEE